ncbi:unnamed protein product, partial [marine sediment metagenome]
DEDKYQIAKEFTQKLVLLSISYKIDKGKYTIENHLNINFEKGGASLKQIHKSIGTGYTKSYVQKIVVGKLKHPRSPHNGKIYPIINTESIPNLKAIVQPDWVSVKDPINKKSSEIEEFSPAWITRVQDIFVLFQDKGDDEEIKLFDYLSYNMGEKIHVLEYRKITFAKFCKLCGLIVDINKRWLAFTIGYCYDRNKEI